MRIRKVVALSSVATLLTCSTAFASVVSEDFSIKINGNRYESPVNEQKPYMNQDDRTMVPIRFISNALGIPDSSIVWNQDTSTATIQGSSKVVVTVGKRSITVNGNEVTMDTSAELTSDRLFIPARFIAESLGAMVTWDDVNKTVEIKSKPSGALTKTDTGFKIEGYSDVTISNKKEIDEVVAFNDYVLKQAALVKYQKSDNTLVMSVFGNKNNERADFYLAVSDDPKYCYSIFVDDINSIGLLNGFLNNFYPESVQKVNDLVAKVASGTPQDQLSITADDLAGRDLWLLSFYDGVKKKNSLSVSMSAKK